MAEHTQFHLRSLDLLREELNLLNLAIPVDEDLSSLADAVPIGDRQLANRFVAQPMEGFDSLDNGGPGDLSVRRYARYAAGRFAPPLVRGDRYPPRSPLESQAALAAQR